MPAAAPSNERCRRRVWVTPLRRSKDPKPLLPKQWITPASEYGAPSARTLFERRSAAPLQPPRDLPRIVPGLGKEKRKRFGWGRTERANARARPLMFPSSGLGGGLDRPARLISEKYLQGQKPKLAEKVERERFPGPRYQPRPPARRSGCIPAEPYPPAGPQAAYTDQPWHESVKSRGIYKGAEPPCSAFEVLRPGKTI